MHTLLFDRAIFREGVNYTVRLGDKWCKLKVGEKINLAQGDVVWGVAWVTDVLYSGCSSIPARVIQLEHDPRCRTRLGLEAELERVYGQEIGRLGVTSVGFVVCPLS
jgi:hypothetical protein